jgi:hypothetical protein
MFIVPDAPRIPGGSPCRCARCATDLSALVPGARFCPRCGTRLGDLSHVRLAFAHGIVRGYASAMFRLGAHHEFRHNDDEAFRCYGKASRLGNEPARERVLDVPPAAVAPE